MTPIELICGIVSSIAATVIVALAIRTYWRWNNNIAITHPRHGERLSDGEVQSTSAIWFPVRGTLRRLPEDHEIWLLVQHDATKNAWPQAIAPVQYDPEKGIWVGKINGSGRTNIRILAVVAPPTSQDFFRYFQSVGTKRNYEFEPLRRIPPECKNVASVQAFIP